MHEFKQFSSGAQFGAWLGIVPSQNSSGGKAIVPTIRGWVQYYGEFRPSTLYRVLRPLDEHLVHWAQRKYKRLEKHKHRAWEWLKGLQSREPQLFPHWWTAMKTTGR